MPQPMANATDKCSVMLIVITTANRSLAIYRDSMRNFESESETKNTNAFYHIQIKGLDFAVMMDIE